MSNSKLILDIIDKSDYNTLFTAKDFYKVTNYQNAKLILNRLCKNGVINRLIDGIYYKPKYVKAINDFARISPYDFAHKIAAIYNWSICASGIAALNLFGLSTQVPNTYVFESDGPYREYIIDGALITFKHTNNKNIKNISYKTGSIIQALKYIGLENINDTIIKTCASKLNKYEKQELLSNMYVVPAWLTKIIFKIGIYYND